MGKSALTGFVLLLVGITLLLLNGYSLFLRDARQHIVAQIYNIDDEGVVTVDGEVKLRATPDADRTKDLGWLHNDARIAFEVFNGGGTYTWGLLFSERAELVAEDAEGVRGIVGAWNKSMPPGQQVSVHNFEIDADGTHRTVRPEELKRNPTQIHPRSRPPSGFKDWIAGTGSSR